ncbi:terminase small subunit-like protein [Microvirga yunnanensis]|uniref:terminase small subunit-like protein n=1 Tax=Microvirga yunnanensis TaxID=2953740 RepID=UPI0021C87DEF|nr:terminase small subunit protein [Microvirga sp. HBU65207]
MSEKRPVGRPRVLTQALKAEICERIAEGETLREICRSEHIPSRSVIHKELLEDEAFADQYARARELQLDMMEDELLEIADDANNDWMERHDKDGNSIGWVVNGEHIQRSRARIETRKWIMSKRAPKKYGDRIRQEIEAEGEPIGFPVVRIYTTKPEEPDAA